MQRCAHHRRRSGRYVFRARRRGERRCGAHSLQKQDRRLRQFGGGHVGAPLRAGRARPARGLPSPLPCLRRWTAGHGDRGVLCRSRCRGHGAAARSRPAARIPDAFGKRRRIPVPCLLLPQTGTHSYKGRAGEAERAYQYHRGGRRDRLRYPHRARPRAGRSCALRRGAARIPGQNGDPLLRRRRQRVCRNEQHARCDRRRLRHGCALRSAAARHGVRAVLSLPHLFAQAGGYLPGPFRPRRGAPQREGRAVYGLRQVSDEGAGKPRCRRARRVCRKGSAARPFRLRQGVSRARVPQHCAYGAR